MTLPPWQALRSPRTTTKTRVIQMTSNPLQQCCSSSSDMNIRSQRTMSEPARNASALLAEALKPGASLDQITLALEAILAVTAKGLGGDASAYAQYQALLLELHVGSDPHTEPTRRWMASQVYLVEDRFAPEPAGFSAVPVEEFRKKVDAEIEARSRVRHPMSVHLFQGTPPVEDVRFFLEHHWVRSYNFYSLLAELAFRFENIEDASVFYRNLYGEAGAETPERSHPALLSHLMTYFDIPLRIDFPALHPLEKAYLNNRIRCVRHTDVAWGLALLYAVESVSCVNHRRIYELLQRLGVPEQPSEFHRLHGTQDEIDTEEMWALIAKFAPSEDFQRKFMQSLARHFEINRAYFDLLWEQMQANSLAMA
ncbi:hypothetical protein AI22_26075 [Pseudomonas aeruginosa YL84]|nr:hypothetical protein AI22_26075 [Pseudomonas aeruginosa YL84]